MIDEKGISKIEKLTERASLGSSEKLKEFREDILNIYKKRQGKIMVGIFGYYEAEYEDGKNGESVIDFLTEEFTKLNFFVLNGKCITYTDKNGKIIAESSIHEDLKEHAFDWGLDIISRIFASITPRAIFLVTKETGCDIDEIEEFCMNRFRDKELGIGFIFVNQTIEKCKFLKEMKRETKHFCCFADDLESCKGTGDKNDCIFTSKKDGCGGISAGRIQKFIRQGHMCICTIDDYKKIPDAALNVFSLPRH